MCSYTNFCESNNNETKIKKKHMTQALSLRFFLWHVIDYNIFVWFDNTIFLFTEEMIIMVAKDSPEGRDGNLMLLETLILLQAIYLIDLCWCRKMLVYVSSTFKNYKDFFDPRYNYFIRCFEKIYCSCDVYYTLSWHLTIFYKIMFHSF